MCVGVRLITDWKPTQFCMRNHLEGNIWVFNILVRGEKH